MTDQPNPQPDDSRERREVIPDWCFEEAARLANAAQDQIYPQLRDLWQGTDGSTNGAFLALARLVQQQCKPSVEKDTIAFVQEWMMSADYEPTGWDRSFAAAIDARCKPPVDGSFLGREERNNAELLASICAKARHSAAAALERDFALREAAKMLRHFARKPPVDEAVKHLARLHEAMASMMELRRQSTTTWEREKKRDAIDVWRKTGDFLANARASSPPGGDQGVVFSSD
jgi:hypothetical protein